MKLLNPGKTVNKIFDEVFNIFDEIDNNYNKHQVNRKSQMINYLENLEYELVICFLFLVLLKKTSNNNYKSYLNEKLNNELNSRDIIYTEPILDLFKFKRVRKNKN